MHWDREGQLSRFDSSVLKLPVLRHSGMLTSNGSIMAGDGASIGRSMRGVRGLSGWPTCGIKAEREGNICTVEQRCCYIVKYDSRAGPNSDFKSAAELS